jgi:homoserine O-succinyltransferase/O-acetyltransferase
MYANHANEGMRCIWHAIQAVEQAKGVSFTVDVFNVRAENHVPDLSYDAYISTGGPGSPSPTIVQFLPSRLFEERGWE